MTRALEDFDELVGGAAIILGEKRKRLALLTRATGATDPVHVIFNLEREIVHDDGGDAWDVEPARGDVGGDENVAASLAEIVEHHLAFVLILVPVNGSRGGESGLPQSSIQEIASSLRAGEHDARVALAELLFENGDAPLPLFLLLEHLDGLRDGLVRGELIAPRPDLNANRVCRERISNLLHSLGPRRGEHDRLTRRRAELEDFLNLRLETHVQHAIRLVQDDVRRLDRAHRRGKSRRRL